MEPTTKNNSYNDYIARTGSFEGFKPQVYVDDAGKRTIGYGFNLDEPSVRKYLTSKGYNVNKLIAGKQGLSEKESSTILADLYKKSNEEARGLLKNFDQLPEKVQHAVTDLHYNMGATKLRGFKKMLSALENQDYVLGAKELKNSKYFTQTGNRARTHYQDLLNVAMQEPVTPAPKLPIDTGIFFDKLKAVNIANIASGIAAGQKLAENFSYKKGGTVYNTNIKSVSTQKTLLDNGNYSNVFEQASVDDVDGFRQYYKQSTPGSFIHYAGSPEFKEQLRVNNSYISDPFLTNFLYNRAGYQATQKKNGGPVYNWIPKYPRTGAKYAQGGWLEKYANGGTIEDQRIPTPTTPSYYPDYPDRTLTNYQMGTPKAPMYAAGSTVWTKQTTPTWVAGTPTPTTTQRKINPSRTHSPSTAMPYPEIKITGPTNPYMPASPPVLQGYNPYKGPMRLHAPTTTKIAKDGGAITNKYKKRVGIPYAINPGISDAGMYVGPTTQRGITFKHGGWLDNL